MPKKKSKGRSKKKTSSKGKTTKSASKKNKADKVEYYADKLYRGLIRLYREKEEDIFSFSLTRSEKAFGLERKNPPKHLRDLIIDKYNGKCAVCGKGFDIAYTTLQFHHVNGNREETNEKNLIPVHADCHIRVHKRANAKFWLYKQRKEKEKGQRQSIWDIPASRSRGRTSRSQSPFLLGQSIWDTSTSKRRKKKKSDDVFDIFKWP